MHMPPAPARPRRNRGSVPEPCPTLACSPGHPPRNKKSSSSSSSSSSRYGQMMDLYPSPSPTGACPGTLPNTATQVVRWKPIELPPRGDVPIPPMMPEEGKQQRWQQRRHEQTEGGGERAASPVSVAEEAPMVLASPERVQRVPMHDTLAESGPAASVLDADGDAVLNDADVDPELSAISKSIDLEYVPRASTAPIPPTPKRDKRLRDDGGSRGRVRKKEGGLQEEKVRKLEPDDDVSSSKLSKHLMLAAMGQVLE